MKKITQVSQLPDWFKKRTYKTKLSDVDWYREIRRRQALIDRVNLGKRLSDQLIDESRQIMLDILEMDDVRPDSLIYWIAQNAAPVSDLTVGESVFLAFAAKISDVSSAASKYEQLLTLWLDAIEPRSAASDRGTPPTFGQYERELHGFLERKDDDQLDTTLEEYLDRLRNPWLSYGRPLNGYPLTIDTQFDDETILRHIKSWLADKRKIESSKRRRPFNDNDFKDWELYKVRELFDLETWAILNNAKILDRVLADALWPDAPDNFSPIDVLRTTARKKSAEVIRFETVIALFGQLLLSYGENFLSK